MGNEFNFILNTDAIIQQVLNQTNIQVSEAFKRFSQNWRQSATRRAGMAEVNERIGRGAQREVQRVYAEKVGKRPSYRQNDRGKWRRYSGERMKKALASSKFMDSDHNGIYFGDMTQILLNQEKYRRLLGDMNVQNILAQMHPTQSTAMDDMSDEERFECVISRHCQTMSERQAVLRQLASEKSELSVYAESMLAENKVEPSSDSAPASSAQ